MGRSALREDRLRGGRRRSGAGGRVGRGHPGGGHRHRARLVALPTLRAPRRLPLVHVDRTVAIEDIEHTVVIGLVAVDGKRDSRRGRRPSA